ncbi:unnamed protein product, partial [Amoebophrya sp. A25]|eukprot:GSA25T00003197001.1
MNLLNNTRVVDLLLNRLRQTPVTHSSDASRSLWAIGVFESPQNKGRSCKEPKEQYGGSTSSSSSSSESKNLNLVTSRKDVATQILQHLLDTNGIVKFAAGEQASLLHTTVKLSLPNAPQLLSALDLPGLLRGDPLDCAAILHALVALQETKDRGAPASVLEHDGTKAPLDVADIGPIINEGLTKEWRGLRPREFSQICFNLGKLVAVVPSSGLVQVGRPSTNSSKPTTTNTTWKQALASSIANKMGTFPVESMTPLDVTHMCWGLAKLGGLAPSDSTLVLMHDAVRRHMPQADKLVKQQNKSGRASLATIRDLSTIIHCHALFLENLGGVKGNRLIGVGEDTNDREGEHASSTTNKETATALRESALRFAEL